MIEEDEFFEKHPDIVKSIVRQGASTTRSKIESINDTNSDSNFQSVTSARSSKKTSTINKGSKTEDKGKQQNRDLSFAKLIRKIKESSQILKASKSGKSIFASASNSIIAQTDTQAHGPQIPIFVKEDLKKDFEKLLKMNGPNFGNVMMITEPKDEGFNDVLSRLESQRLPILQQTMSQAYDMNYLQSLQPPIGLTARLSPKGLKEKFKYPEFQNKFLESSSKSPIKRSLASKHKSYQLSKASKTIDQDQSMNLLEKSVDSVRSNVSKGLQQLHLKSNKVSKVELSEGMTELPEVIKFCRQENIAFNDSEKMHYDISMCKKNHRMFTKCLKQCFKSSYLDEYQVAVKQLNRFENVVSRQGTANDKQQDILNNVQDLQQYAHEIKQRKYLMKQQSIRENQQRRIITELESKIDQPQSNTHFHSTLKSKAKRNLPQIRDMSNPRGNRNEGSKIIITQIERAKAKMQRSKHRLSKDLIKVLDKHEIDRPLIIQKKANLIIMEDETTIQTTQVNGLQSITEQDNKSLTQRAKESKKVKYTQLLEEMKRQYKKQIDNQKQIYLMLLDYIKMRAKYDRECRVLEQERMIFDALKVIFDWQWLIEDADQFIQVLNEIKVLGQIDEQLYFFIWYIFELFQFETQKLDHHLECELQIDLSFAQKRKSLLKLLVYQQIQQQLKTSLLRKSITNRENADNSDFKQSAQNKRSIHHLLLKTLSGSEQMAEEFKNQALAQSYQVQSNSSKGFNISASEFNPKKFGKQQSNVEITIRLLDKTNLWNIGGAGAGAQDKSNWVPQKKEPKKQWRRKDAAKDNPPAVLAKPQSTKEFDSRHKKEPKTISKISQGSSKLNTDSYDDFKSVQKQMSMQDRSANSLLGFTYNDDDYFGNQTYSNSYKNFNRRRRGGKYYRPAKEYNIQSAFKFIVKKGKDYLLNIYDPNENIDWKDVVQVIFNMINASDVQCPICLENLPQMIAPKITKCGHIYCWPCVLQYLAYERERNWKRCPLCNESVYKHELKNVKIIQSNYYKEGSVIKFNLMVRNKANIIVKDKHIDKSDIEEHKSPRKTTLPTNKLPLQNSTEYHSCRVLVCDPQTLKRDIERDLEILKEDYKLMQSSQEFTRIPYINEAIEHCTKELVKVSNPNMKDDDDDEVVDFEEKKRVHNKKQTLKKETSTEEIEENAQDCFYFYQSSTGENIFLHPLCFKILQQQYSDYSQYPTQIEAQVLEVNQGIADQDDPEFSKYKDLSHLPDGASYGFVEVDMSELVSDAVYRDFEKQIAYRERHRKRKQEREETYAGKVENFHNEKFEQIKRQAINSINTDSVFLKPGVVRNYAQRGSQDDEELKEEEVKQEIVEEDPATMTKDQKLWKKLGDLMTMDKNSVQSIRKDTLEGVDLSAQAKKAIEDKKRKNSDDFECREDGFMFASSKIVVMEGKGPKKRKRGGRH